MPKQKTCGITDDGTPDRPDDELQLVCTREPHEDEVHWNDTGTIWTTVDGDPVRTPDGGTEPVHLTEPAPGFEALPD